MKTKQAKLIIRSPVGTFFRYVEIEDCAESSFEYVRDFLLITKSVSALDENGVLYVLPKGLLEQSAFTIQDM